MKKINGVIFAEKNMVAECFSDPNYNLQWYLKNTGQSGGTINADINIEPVWTFFSGNSNIKVGVIDEGILLNHEDLNGRCSGDWPDMGTSHGSHVAGLIGAIQNNNLGIKGVDNYCQIVSKRIFDQAHYGQYNQSGYVGNVDAATKIIEAVDQGCSFLNNSWGGAVTSDLFTLHYAFIYAYNMNSLSIISMGNSGNNTVQYPAGWGNGQGVITVGATNHNGIRESYSSYGNNIEVMAPGGTNSGNYSSMDIWSAGELSTNTYLYKSGTSMAAPLVTGIASLLKGYNTNLSNDDIENVIKNSCTDISPQGWDEYTGFGSVNAKKAFDMIQQPNSIIHSSINGNDNYFQVGGYHAVSIYLGTLNGNYFCKKYEVRKNISYDPTYRVKVWGRGVGTLGFADEGTNSYLFNTGFCEPVPGTVTNNSATLRTYVYEFWSTNGSYQGWYPCQPSQVHYEYTVQGMNPPPPPPVISNITQSRIPLISGTSTTFTCVLTPGSGPVDSYTWSMINETSFNITYTTSSTNQFTIHWNPTEIKDIDKMPDYRIWIKCIVNGYGNDTKTISTCYSVNPPTGCPWLVVTDKDTIYSFDNNLLNKSQLPENQGSFITDKYILKTKPGIFDNKIKLSIVETNTDSTIINNIKLYAVTHPLGTKLGILSNNTIVMYDSASVIENKSASLYDPYNNYTDISNYIHFNNPDKTNNNNTTGDSLYHIYAEYVTNTISNPGIITYMEHGILPIYPWAKDSYSGNLFINTTIGVSQIPFMRRENPDDVIIPVNPGSRKGSVDSIHIAWDKSFKIQYAAIASLSYTGFTVTEWPLVTAFHTSDGDVLQNLLYLDSGYTYVSPNAYLNLEFSPPANQVSSTSIKEYVLEINGQVIYLGNNKIRTSKVTKPNQNTIPDQYSLSQNYPNPFNPVTKINYSIPQQGFVTLKIYDLLGREIKSLVSETKQPGNYSVDFNGSNLASGVYFYRLESNSFTSIKRMILIK